MLSHKHPVGLTLGYRTENHVPVTPVTITGHLSISDGVPMYGVENQLTGEMFFAMEPHLVARAADYLQLSRAYQMVAIGLESEAGRAETAMQLEDALQLMQASNLAYRRAEHFTHEATAILKRRL